MNRVAPSARHSQLRFIFSLLKPAVRAAAAFRVPIQPLLDLCRLAYFEHLRREGLPMDEVASRLGQTPRHMRSLARKLETAFFEPERDDGLERDIEAAAGAAPIQDDELCAQLGSWTAPVVRAAVDRLLLEGRLDRGEDGALRAAQRYVILRDDTFAHRIDSLNHFLDGAYRAVTARLVRDERRLARMKTISFSATEADLCDWIARLEGELRRDVAEIDETAELKGRGGDRYILTLGLAPKSDEP